MGRSIFGMILCLLSVPDFFRGLCKTAAFISHYCKINSINPVKTSLLWDPWLFDIPAALKPTYLNMDVELDQIHLSDLIFGDQWDFQGLYLLFGNHIDNFDKDFTSIDHNSDNHWIWMPKSSCTKISSAVYHFLNKQFSSSEH